VAVFALDLILDLICLGTASDRIGTHPPARGLIHTSVGASVYSVSDGCPVTLPMIQETTHGNRTEASAPVHARGWKSPDHDQGNSTEHHVSVG